MALKDNYHKSRIGTRQMQRFKRDRFRDSNLPWLRKRLADVLERHVSWWEGW